MSQCDRPAAKRGYCTGHYQRLRAGDLRADVPLRPKKPDGYSAICAVEACEKPTRKRDWCMRHYDRWREHGDPEYKARPQGHRYTDHASGYVRIHSGGCAPNGSEHRMMWEARYGPLLPGQNIHHKNGDRADNRYENLEIWDTQQPAGQRPEDKVEFAIAMLRRYAPHLLTEQPII